MLAFPGVTNTGDVSARARLIRITFALALLVFLVRGVLRALHGSTDLAWGYLSSRAWALGGNPYSVTASEALAPSDFPNGLDLDGVPTPYTPGFFLIFSFYRWLSWSEAIITNLILGCFAIGVVLWLLAIRLPLPPEQRLLFIALVLLGYPLSTGVALGQPSVFAVACALGALVVRRSSPDNVLASLLTAASLVFKPQVGIAVVLHLVLSKNWMSLAITGAFYGAINAIAMGLSWLGGATLDPLSGLLSGVAKVAMQQADAYCCVNLNQTRIPWIILVLSVLLPFGAVLVRSWQEKVDTERQRLLLYGVAATTTLLIVYQRPYNLVLLTPLLVFALSTDFSRSFRLLILILLLPSIQPIPWLPLSKLIESHLAPPWQGVFHALARPLHSWSLLILLYLLAFEFIFRSRRTPN